MAAAPRRGKARNPGAGAQFAGLNTERYDFMRGGY
jgi:hypothetical protein